MPERYKVVLTVAPESEKKLKAFVEDCLQRGVSLIAVAGENCIRIEDIIDELVVGDGSDENRYILTSSHPGEDVASVIEFARASFKGEEYGDDVQLVNL